MIKNQTYSLSIDFVPANLYAAHPKHTLIAPRLDCHHLRFDPGRNLLLSNDEIIYWLHPILWSPLCICLQTHRIHFYDLECRAPFMNCEAPTMDAACAMHMLPSHTTRRSANRQKQFVKWVIECIRRHLERCVQRFIWTIHLSSAWTSSRELCWGVKTNVCDMLTDWICFRHYVNSVDVDGDACDELNTPSRTARAYIVCVSAATRAQTSKLPRWLLKLQRRQSFMNTNNAGRQRTGRWGW